MFLYLCVVQDAGQKQAGHVTCPVCKMVYMYAEPNDQLEHNRFHRKLTSTIQFNVCTVISCVLCTCTESIIICLCVHLP